MELPVVVQHVAGFEFTGGPQRQLRHLLASPLREAFTMPVVSQNRPAGGVNWGLIRELAEAMRRHRPDLVHVRGLQNEGFHGVMAARRAGCRKVLVSIHGFAEDAIGRRWLNKMVLKTLIEPMTLARADAFYCVCAHAAKRPLVRRFASKFVGIIPNAAVPEPTKRERTVVRESLGAKPGDVVALYAGRITRDKGLFVLADALKESYASGEAGNLKVWLAGDGPDEPALRNALAAWVSTGHVCLLGRRRDMPDLFAAADFFVFPTLHENMSNAVLEAMQAGLAVLTTDVGGNPEVVADEETGWLLPAGNSKALSSALRQWCRRADLRGVLGRAGRRRVETLFSMDQVAARLGAIYRQVLDFRDGAERARNKQKEGVGKGLSPARLNGG